MITGFKDLLEVARTESEPQRLLFVFCKAELPEDATAEEKSAFDRGEGGALTPVICVDKTPSEVPEFERLVVESEQTGQNWDVVFVAAMSGRGGIEPSSDDVQQPMNMMVESIRLGKVANFLPLDRAGVSIDLGL
ncbi:ribonucleotide reductase subunit alpha [uncultured Marinobacter sp.]|uniref:ribonucleotide reductase subunit alpha n=1 Tax=uncultured Marinobacter sp. TaxID=187379 RepID=UPI0030DD4BC9